MNHTEQILKIFHKYDPEDSLEENWFCFITLSNEKLIVMNEDHTKFTEVSSLNEFIKLFATGQYYGDDNETTVSRYEIAQLE